MKTAVDDLPLLQKSKKNFKSYGSAFWLCDHDVEMNVLRVTIGWALQDHSGALGLCSSIPFREPRSAGILSAVEETQGAIFHKPSDFEEQMNAHAERLTSDWLMFLTHRMLFNQCKGIDSSIPSGETDIFMVYGPILPKFAGRVCYSNFTRKKTVAIIAPSIRHGEVPEQNSFSWTKEPNPRFCHDCAQRSWTTDPDGNDGKNLRRVASFDLLEPVGDGFSGRILGTSSVGPAKWLAKSEEIQKILDQDREELKLAFWKNHSVYLPRGIKSAAIAAFCQREIDRSQDRFNQIKLGPKFQEIFEAGQQKMSSEAEGMRVDHRLKKEMLKIRGQLNYARTLQDVEFNERATRATQIPSPPRIIDVKKELSEILGQTVFE
jgi:hypothetical protein